MGTIKSLFFNTKTKQISFESPVSQFTDIVSFPFMCILGVVKTGKDSQYLFFCTEGECVGIYNGQEIFAIEKVEFVSLGDSEDSNAESIKNLMETVNFYFTFESIDEHFRWNKDMLDNFKSMASTLCYTADTKTLGIRSPFSTRKHKEITDLKVTAEMFCGYFECSTAKKNEKDYCLKILSKISMKKIGTRMLSRGVDERGKVSFFVETRFAIEEYNGKSKSEEWNFTILRGSVPVFWSQDDPLKPHKINFDGDEAINREAFKMHMKLLSDGYGKVTVIDLLGHKKYEKILSKMYRNLCKESDVDYLHFDLNKHAEDIENIKGVFYEQLENYLKSVKDDKKNSVVFRVNCMDCLDRTNIAQYLIFSFFDPYKFSVSKSMWVNNGNALSKMYTGSDTLKSELPSKGKISVLGRVNDLVISANRMINNRFTDKDKQKVIEMILGKHSQK